MQLRAGASKHYTFIFISVVVMLTGCTHASKPTTPPSQKPKTVTANDRPEDFDTFFKRFETEPTFQTTRVTFPAKVITTAEDSDTKTERYIKRADWKYANVTDKKTGKWIIKKDQISKVAYKVSISLEDTGVSVEYVFNSKDGKWWLAYVNDNSD